MHAIVHAAREDVCTMIAWTVEAERRLERRSGGDKLTLIEQGNPSHEVAHRQGNGIAGVPDRDACAVHQLPCLRPITSDVRNSPLPSDRVNQPRGVLELFGKLEGAAVNRPRLRGREPPGRPDRGAECQLQLELASGADIDIEEASKRSEPTP